MPYETTCAPGSRGGMPAKECCLERLRQARVQARRGPRHAPHLPHHPGHLARGTCTWAGPALTWPQEGHLAHPAAAAPHLARGRGHRQGRHLRHGGDVPGCGCAVLPGWCGRWWRGWPWWRAPAGRAPAPPAAPPSAPPPSAAPGGPGSWWPAAGTHWPARGGPGTGGTMCRYLTFTIFSNYNFPNHLFLFKCLQFLQSPDCLLL